MSDSCVLSRMGKRRSVSTMENFFNAVRGISFRRGPQRLLGGIGGGLAELLGINVWLAQLLVLLSFLLPVLSWGLYALVWVLTPWQDGTIPLERALGGEPGRG